MKYIKYIILLLFFNILYSNNEIKKDSIYTKIKTKYSSSDFDYSDVIYKNNFLDRLMQKINDFFNNLFSSLNIPFNVEKIFFIIIIIVIIIVLFFILRKVKIRNINYKKDVINENNVQFIEKKLDEIEEFNLLKHLNESKEDKNFIDSIRFLFLINLKKLNDYKHIKWNNQKTNSDFYKEIFDQNLKKDFLKTSNIYDYVCFGNKHINENDFLEAEKLFINFKNQIK